MLTLHPEADVPATSKSLITDTRTNPLIEQWESYPKSSGKTLYLRYLHGEKISYKEACLAKCAECCAGYGDGRLDCGIPICPLYDFMPYKGKQSDMGIEFEQ